MATFQPDLFSATAPAVRVDPTFKRVQRIALDETAWVDWLPGWVEGADQLFAQVLKARCWAQRRRMVHGKEMIEPRLTSLWYLGAEDALGPPVLEEMRMALSRRYGVTLDSVGFNHYRDGDDSVAWHRDTIAKTLHNPVVALVSLGEARKFLLRPYGGGASVPFKMGHGDLLVTGGTAQRTWEHTIPKVAHAGPRISMAFRHGLESKAYTVD